MEALSSTLVRADYCLQAVAKLYLDTELTLRFRLQGIEHAIETAGRVTWLGPTKKEAGISFKDLPGNKEQQITEWIASQEWLTQGSGTQTEPRLKHPPANVKAPALPIQASIPVIPPYKEPVNAHSSFAGGVPLPPRLAPDSLPMGAGEPPPRDSVLLGQSWIFTSGGIIPTDVPMPAVRESPARQYHWRRRNVAIGAVVGFMVILALIVMIPNLGKFLGPGVSGEQPAGPISPRVAMATMSPRSPDPLIGADCAPLVPATHQTWSVPHDPGWFARLEDFLGIGVTRKMDPALEGVLVWAVKQNGYYYCADSPNFVKLETGTIMAQGEALQSGYQPKVGDYCQ